MASPGKDRSSPRSLVVIGAGAAGITVAHTLLKTDPAISVTIVEANDYIGGRVRHTTFDGHTVELGANWISGREETFDNPVWNLAKAVNLRGHVSDREDASNMIAIDCGSGNDITDPYLEAVGRFNECYERSVEEVAKREMNASNDICVREMLTNNGWPSMDKSSVVERAVEHNMLEVWGSEDLEKLSSFHDMRPNANDVELGKDELFVEDSRGFNCIFNAMVDDLKELGCKIELGQAVTTIKYNPDGVEVRTEETKYSADAVVCTVSLGVLQSDIIEFQPKLPPWKLDAFSQMGMFNFAKVYAKFDTQFWPNKDQLVFIMNDQKGKYPLWMRYRHTSNDQHLFVCWLGGAEARRVESLSNENLSLEIEDLFRNAFKDTVEESTDIFKPALVASTDWSTNSKFCGSYSYFPVGAFSKVHESLITQGMCGCDEDSGRSEKKPTTLFFAGEAFDDKFNGWVQGAYLSGKRVAEEILKSLR